MIHLFGNCQTTFLGDALARKGVPNVARVLASPFTYTSGKGTVPGELRVLDGRYGLEHYMHARTFVNQFEMLSPEEGPAELVVFNLFHETTPLVLHEREGYAFFVDTAVWDEEPEFKGWVESHCRMIRLNPMTYYQRFGAMIEQFRSRHPEPDILVLTRLSHYPAFGPDPYSYLECWGETWPGAVPALEEWIASLERCHVLDMDKVFGGIWSDSERAIESHCPFLRFADGAEGSGGNTLSVRRDVEHVGSMWPRLADKIVDFLAQGSIVYAEKETISKDWSVPFSPERLTREAMDALLASGGNYLCARAIGSFFQHLEEDYSDLLVANKQAIPICHNTLHMMKHYGRVHRNPALAELWRVQEEKAATYTGNGPAYQQRYLDSVRALQSEWAS